MVKSNTLFNVVVIKSKEEEKYFIGKLPCFLKLTGAAVIRNMLEFKGREGTCPYKKLTEAVDGKITNFSVNLLKKECNHEEISKVIFNMQKKLIEKYGEDCILNDVVIDPTTYNCECGQKIREQFREKHAEFCILKSIGFDEEFCS